MLFLFTRIYKSDLTLFFKGYVFLPGKRCKSDRLFLKIEKFRDEDIQFSQIIKASPPANHIYGTIPAEIFQEYSGTNIYEITCEIDIEKIKNYLGQFDIFFEHNNVLVTPSNYFKTIAERDYFFPVKLID